MMTDVERQELQARIAHAPRTALEHFLDLAERALLPASSGGEKRALALARAICEHVPGLDASAAAGAIDFIRLTARKPFTARQLIGDA